MLPLHALLDACLVVPEHAGEVIAPAYDALDPAQRRAHIAAHPDTFLRALPTGERISPRFHEQRRALHDLHRRGRFRPLPRPSAVVLELTEGADRITAVIADVAVEAYLDGRIRPHEHVRPDRVRELATYLSEVQVASSPVCVFHRRHPGLDELLVEVQRAPPDLDTPLAPDGHVRAWSVSEPSVRRRLLGAAAEVEDATVADGHHRAAAVARRVGPDAVHGAHRPGLAGPRPAEQHRLVLTALVTGEELTIAPFHRRIDGLGDVTVEEVTGVLAEVGRTTVTLPGPQPPTTAGTVHLAVAGRWLALTLAPPTSAAARDGLDASRAEEQVVAPLRTLGTGPGPPEVVPVPAPAGLAALERPGSVGVALVPPTLEQVLTVTGAGQVLPHKSTYLRPKLRSGILTIPR